jgi:hypothetical protein
MKEKEKLVQEGLLAWKAVCARAKNSRPPYLRMSILETLQGLARAQNGRPPSLKMFHFGDRDLKMLQGLCRGCARAKNWPTTILKMSIVA